jgi:hypothetical protein
MPEGAALSPREGLKIGLGLTMAGPRWVQPWEGGRRELSLGLESRGVSHRWSPVMRSASRVQSRLIQSRNRVPSRTVGPVGGSSRWVQSVGPVTRSRSRGAPRAQPLYCGYEDWLLPLCQFRKNFLERASPLASLLGTADGRVLVCRTC